MSEFELWVKQELSQPLQNEVNRFRTPMIVFGILALVIVARGIVLLCLLVFFLEKRDILIEFSNREVKLETTQFDGIG